MSGEFDYPVIENFRGLYEDGFRCIKYEVDELDDLFTVYLKNFDNENTEVIKCNSKEGMILKNYIDRIS